MLNRDSLSKKKQSVLAKTFPGKIQQTHMTTTQQDLLDFLKKLKPIPQTLIDELNDDYEFTIAKWMARTETQWEKIAGVPNGIDIYNFLHPSPQSSRSGSETELSVTAPLTSALESLKLNAVEPSRMIRLSDDKLFLLVGDELRGYIQHSSRSVLIRRSYVELYERFMTTECSHTIVTGSPGIGKSLFLIYCAFRLIDLGFTVALAMDNNPFIYLINKSRVIEIDSKIDHVQLGNLLKNSKPFVWLADSRAPLKWPYQKALLVTSPRVKYANDFAKVAATYHMPIWTLEELLSLVRGANISLVDEATLTHRFGILNGIPRRIFNITDTAEDMIRRAIECSPGISQLLSKPISSGSTTEVSHTLIVINTSDYLHETADYASNYVFEQVRNYLLLVGKNQLLKFVRDSQGNRSLGQMRGRWYEMIAHQVLRGGGKFRRRKLKSPDEMKKSRQTRTNSTEIEITKAAHLVNDFSTLDQAYEDLKDNQPDIYF